MSGCENLLNVLQMLAAWQRLHFSFLDEALAQPNIVTTSRHVIEACGRVAGDGC